MWPYDLDIGLMSQRMVGVWHTTQGMLDLLGKIVQKKVD